MFNIISNKRHCNENRVIVPNVNYSEEFVKTGVTLAGSFSLQFNKKLYELFPNQRISVLDLGCGGGNFVKTIIEEGHIAIGVDCFYIYEKFMPASWNIIPNNLFMCDISSPFQIYQEKDQIKFDVITSWEFMEHLYEEDVNGVMSNIINNLKEKGYYICSISYSQEYGHFCIRDREWWVSKFKEYNLLECEHLKSYFSEYPRQLDNSYYFNLQKQ